MTNAPPAARTRIATIVALYVAGLLVIAVLRYWQQHLEVPPAAVAYVTPLYIALTIITAVTLVRAGVPFNRLGFAVRIPPYRVLGLALFGIALLQASSVLLTPLWEWLFSDGRDLSRFSAVAGSPDALVRLLTLSWTFAAFGEELAFRILLLRSIAYLLGNDRNAHIVAVLLQALVFGLVHAYQGPAGFTGSAISGLVFGALVVAGRGSIWPAALAHGGNNTIGILRLFYGV